MCVQLRVNKPVLGHCLLSDMLAHSPKNKTNPESFLTPLRMLALWLVTVSSWSNESANFNVTAYRSKTGKKTRFLEATC